MKEAFPGFEGPLTVDDIVRVVQAAREDEDLERINCLSDLPCKTVEACLYDWQVAYQLTFAVDEYRQDLLNALLAKGIRLPLKPSILCAAYTSHEEIINFLFHTGFPGYDCDFGSNSFDVITDSVERRLENAMEAWRSGFADVNRRDSMGGTPLHYAATYGMVSEVKELLDMGADISLCDFGGYQPLHLVSEKGHLDCFQILIDYGADVNATTKDGLTPLHVAADEGRLEICEMLLALDADPTIISQKGETPLHLAVKSARFMICELLLDHGALSNVVAKNGKTPLQLAQRAVRLGLHSYTHDYASIVDLLSN